MKSIDEIRKELGEIIKKYEEGIGYSYGNAIETFAINYFGRLPYLNQLTDNIFDEIDPTNIDGYDEMDEFSMKTSHCTAEEYREKYKNIDFNKTLENILDAYPDAIIYTYKAGKLENKTIFHDTFIYNDGIFYMDTPELPQKIYDCIAEKEYKPQIRWILRNSRGNIENRYMEINQVKNIQDNYNDDFFPINDKIIDVIHRDESSIMILHGKPGTGKSSYIRNLIAENSDIKFYWIDSSMFLYVDSSEFIEFISTCKNAVFILEDSECLLKTREGSNNTAMQSLLNISDGILGDSLKLKFICTFNTDLTNIDKAILRKGRMRVKYEFKDLKKNKVEKIFEKLGIDKSLAKDMPLCDAYNFLEDNGNNTTKNKIGF